MAAACAVCRISVHGGDGSARAVASPLDSGSSISEFLARHDVVDADPGASAAGENGLLCSGCVAIVVQCDGWEACFARGIEQLKKRRFASAGRELEDAFAFKNDEVPAVVGDDAKPTIEDLERYAAVFQCAAEMSLVPSTSSAAVDPLDTNLVPSSEQSEDERSCHSAAEDDGEFAAARSACSECGSRFRSDDALKVHLHRRHGAPKPYPCRACGAEFLWRSSLNTHAHEKHSDAPPFVRLCPECGETLTGYEAFRWHRRKHREQGRPKPTCEVCGSVLADRKGLRNHLANVHGVGEKTKRFEASCERCGKTYRSRDLFCGHMYREHGVELPELKKLACPHCGEVYHKKDIFDEHVAIHLGEKKFACPDCDYKATYGSALRKHGKRCKGKKRVDDPAELEKLKRFKKFACPTCDYRTENSGNLRKHVPRCGKKRFRKRRSTVPQNAELSSA